MLAAPMRPALALLALALLVLPGCTRPETAPSPGASTASITFRVHAPGVSALQLAFPFQWGASARPNVDMQRKGDSFEAAVALPVGALVRYAYAPVGLDYDHREQVQPGREASRALVVARDQTVEDEAWAFGPDATPRSARLSGRVLDNATGEPVLEPIVVADGILASTLNGTFDVAVRDRAMLVTVYTLDGSHRARSLVVRPGEMEVRLDAAPLARVRLVATGPTPPHHEVRVFGTAAQIGPRFLYQNRFIEENFQTMPPGGLDLDLHEGQWVDYLYSVGNVATSYERREDGSPVVRGFVAHDGLVLRDALGSFVGDRATWFNVTVPAYTSPTEVVGIKGTTVQYLPMHRVNATSWTLVESGDAKGLAYRYYKGVPDAGDEAKADRVVAGPAMEDVVAAWKQQDGPIPAANAAAPPIQHAFDLWAYPPDLYGTMHAVHLPELFDRYAAEGYHGVVVNQVMGYAAIDPLPRIQRDDPMTLYLPTSEAMRAAKLAHARNLSIYEYTQMVGGEALLPHPRAFNATWWAAWLEENERFNVEQARLAQAAGMDQLLVHGREPGFDVTDPAILAQINGGMRHIIAQMRQQYRGTLVAVYDPFTPAFDYWKDTDVIAQSAPAYNLSANATQADVDAWAAGFLDSRLAPLNATLGKPIELQVSAQSVQGALSGVIVPESEGANTEVNHAKPWSGEEQRMAFEAFLKAANARPWIRGVYVRSFGLTDVPLARDDDVRGKPAEAYAAAWGHALAAARGSA